MKSIIASAGMALVMEALQLVYYSRFLLPVYVAVGLLVYLLGMRALKAIRREEVDLLRSIPGSRSERVCGFLSRLVVSA